MKPKYNQRKQGRISDVIEDVPKLRELWKPTTELGIMVKDGRITDIEQIFSKGLKIMEADIVNVLLPGLEEDLLLIGQAKGKFGGGQRRIFRQTQKKTREGNRIQFMTCAVVGNKNGYVGVATGKSKETVPARDKAKRKARLNLMRIRRGSGSWESDSKEPTSIPFAVTGKCGSIRLTLMPAPIGTGLCIEKECAKILSLAGIKDIWSKTEGQTKTKLNLIEALLDALRNLTEAKVRPEDVANLGLVDGKLKSEVVEESVIETVEEIQAEAEGNEVVDDAEAGTEEPVKTEVAVEVEKSMKTEESVIEKVEESTAEKTVEKKVMEVKAEE
jgi:small subunit ribosomal protein S5